MEEPKISRGQSKLLADTKYVKLYDLAYQNGVHYYDASRRDADRLFAFKQEKELGTALPDAACAIVIIKERGEEEKLLLFYEYRYPAGSYLLGVPAGLIDPADLASPDPIKTAMIREIKEETGLSIGEGDTVEVINPLVFTASGFSDESNAIVKAVVHVDDLSALNHQGAEGTEVFGNFKLVSRDEARRLLQAGRDDYGHYLPLVTWGALCYFVSDLWK
ncbi:DNA mismatch repair protein MutT [Lactobacillus nasalidis]|uniref:DNA mismatch repair protein MutT n=1 Tax=Lactobacillus nasalidis TaxID=2797258 RepID=A0ABQ3W5Q0_9LACO|nr:NUDIX hydrolase [Lactobacillus nasalidis]GHV97815.1 DNA mismatch repair protein MutT [Lactobacillus nasalidis]GHV99544.1 DNA mismatch repair protein MutT [Lactobacillus nasalidis]GHW01024.1 DNA mismatch repair protein MutT [Lactobacillus nasalidis]